MGRRAADFKPRVSGPGPMSRRTDMDGSQPIRVPSGGDYGERRAIEGAQQAVPVPEGGPLGEAPAMGGGGGGGGGGAPDLTGLLSEMPSTRPDEDIAAGAGARPLPRAVSAQNLAALLESVIHSQEVVPAGLVRMWEAIKSESV